MWHPKTHPLDGSLAHDIRNDFANLVDRPLVIVGSGPSAAVPRHDLLPADPVVFRMNWFFLEDHYHFGTKVDAYFFAIPNRELESRLVSVMAENWYDIDRVFTPMRVPHGRDGEEHASAFHEAGVREFDHWSLIAQNPTLARFMMSRPLPTQGAQVLAMALQLGFTDITLCGIDMYESTSSRYSYAIPDAVKDALGAKDLTPGYEDAHSLDRDLDFIDACIAQYPDARIQHIGPSRHLASRFPTPERRATGGTFGGVDAREVARLAKPTLAIDGATSAQSDELPYALIDDKRCGFVTVVSGPFHHGVRALARSLAKVSDVPLTVMCAPSADRAKLRASGLVCVDVPEIHNPNKLGRTTSRFAATYTKLQAFRMTHLDRAVYLDADMIVLQPIDDLFASGGFRAVPDHGLDYNYGRFNSGMFAFEPNAGLFDELVQMTTAVESYDLGDQGFLNEMFPDWEALPHEYNVNKRWSAHHPNKFRLDEVKVLHYVGIKPWQHEPTSAYDELYRLWYSFLTREELVDVAESLRRSGSMSIPGSGTSRGGWRALIRALRSRIGLNGRAAPTSSTGTLQERTHELNTRGSFVMALELVESEWPGDSFAKAGLFRERARTQLLNGRFDEAGETLHRACQRFPTDASIRSLAASVDRVLELKTKTYGLIPDSVLRTAIRLRAA